MLWVVAGPTASGKTALAISLAKELKTEILSFDSRQFFREIPIGTAAPTHQEQQGVKHHFIGNKSISESYSAGDFARDARSFCHDWFNQHNHLVAAGGSGLYLNALLRGFDDMPEISDAVRKEINDAVQKKGLTWLQNEVKSIDPEHFDKTDNQNPRRLIRCLEVYRSSGKRLSDLQRSNTQDFFAPVRLFGLEWARETLYARIETRVDAMMDDGLENEVRSVAQYRNHQALQTVGYRELFNYIDGECSLDDAVDQIKTNTRRYAKRQLTWFRNRESLEWISPDIDPQMLIL